MTFKNLIANWQQLASDGSVKACREALDNLWLLAQPVTVELLQHQLNNIEQLPESSVDDSRTSLYLAMRAISILAYALGAQIGEPAPARALEYSISALLQLSADLGGPELEEWERENLERLRQRLKESQFTGDLVVEIKLESIQMAGGYTKALKKSQLRPSE